MKKSINYLLLLVFAFCISTSLYAQDDREKPIKIIIKRPPPQRLNQADLWNITIINSGQSFSAYLFGSMTNNENGELIATGQTMTFEVNKGTTNFKVSDLPKVPDVSYLSKDPKYKQSFMNTGGAPPGDYKVCIELRYTNNTVAGDDCFEQKIIGSDAPQLISPKDEEELNISNPVFTWMHMKAPGSEQSYTLKIVELKGDESPENAMLKNKAFFEKEGITQQMFQYPSSAPKFEEEKKYAWGVLDIRNNKWSDFRILNQRLKKISCKDLTVNIKNSDKTKKDDKENSNKRDTMRNKDCCFDISITNNYTGLLTSNPYAFRVTSRNATIISANSLPFGWSRNPGVISPNTNSIIWNNSSGAIPNGVTKLGTLCFGNIRTDPFYVVYDWMNKDGKVICKDSIKLSCSDSNKTYGIDTTCKSNIVQNGNFFLSNIPGLMPVGSVLNWSIGYGSPNVHNDPNEGCWDLGYIELSGNKNSGNCIKQVLSPSNKIILGKKYKLSIAIKFVSQNSSTDYVKIRAIAFNNSLPSLGSHPLPNSDIAVIGISPQIKACSDWTVNVFHTWVANKNFDNIAINAENNENSQISNAFIDNVQMCEVNEDVDCYGISLDEHGKPIIPSNLAPYMRAECPPITEYINQLNGNVNDLYGSLCPGFVPGTDTWYQNCPDPCFSVGGTLPDEVKNFDCNKLIQEMGLNISCEELMEMLKKPVDIEEPKIKLRVIMPPAPKRCDSLLKFVPNPSLPFGGRDIIFIHGLKLDHLCDKASEIAGADKEWPTDRNEFFGNGYFKKRANETWEDHIWNFLQSRQATNLPTNRYLTVSYNCNQRAEVGANAILDQIREAMDNGEGVVSNGDRRGKECFGKEYVIISHSTGGLVTDIALSIAQRTTTDPVLAAKWGNLGFIYSGLKTHIALQGALSGSNLAKLFVALQGTDLTSKIAYRNMRGECENGSTWVRPEIVNNSILIDLIPEYTNLRWGSYINSVPVPTLTVAGGHLENGLEGFLQNQVHRGNDDGVLSMDCACGNPTFQLNAPTYFEATSIVKAFDMGIEPHRGAYYFFEQKAPGLLTSYQFNAGCIPFLSPTGMVEPVASFSGNSMDRWRNHFSFIQSTSDHFGGPRGRGADHGAPFILSNAINTSGYQAPLFDYVTSDGTRNWEESRVVTDPSIYTNGLVNGAMINSVYEEQRGLEISFTIYWPEFYNWRLKWVGHTFSFWIWKRKYHLLENSQTKTECDYVYQYILR